MSNTSSDPIRRLASPTSNTYFDPIRGLASPTSNTSNPYHQTPRFRRNSVKLPKQLVTFVIGMDGTIKKSPVLYSELKPDTSVIETRCWSNQFGEFSISSYESIHLSDHKKLNRNNNTINRTATNLVHKLDKSVNWAFVGDCYITLVDSKLVSSYSLHRFLIAYTPSYKSVLTNSSSNNFL